MFWGREPFDRRLEEDRRRTTENRVSVLVTERRVENYRGKRSKSN